MAINRTASRHNLDRFLKMVVWVNSAQRDGALVSNDGVFPSLSGHAVDESSKLKL